MRMLQISRFFLLPVLLLGLGAACSSHHSDPNSVSSPPAITVQPVNTSTVTGRLVSLSVTATGASTPQFPLSYQWAKDGLDILGARAATFTLYSPNPQDSGSYTVTVTNAVGSITSSPAILTVAAAVTFQSAVGVVSDALGNLYVSDANDHTIWKVDPANQKTLLAGSPGLPGSSDGQGSNAQFRNPGGLALDPAGNLVVADTGNHTIRRIAPDGTVTTLAGSPGVPGSADGVGAQARFNAPYGIAVDGSGTVYIADTQNHTIRHMATDGTVTTYAGAAGQPGLANGANANALFNQPNGLALAPDGTLVVADYGNSCIRTISPAGQVSTLAGSGTSGFADGAGALATFYWPVGVAVDASGTIWVADTHNHAIRKVLPDHTVSTLAGLGGTPGNADGTGTTARFSLPCGIATTPSGNLIVADTYNHILRVVTPAGVVTTPTAP